MKVLPTNIHGCAPSITNQCESIMNRLRVFIFLLLAAACKEPEAPICKECGSDVKYVSTFFNYYFRYITYPDGPRLVRLDSTTNLSTPYKTCYFEGINDLEESKIIRATGGFTESCFGKEDPLQVERFEVIDICMPSIPTIDKKKAEFAKGFLPETIPIMSLLKLKVSGF
jgi:hypothetical protein